MPEGLDPVEARQRRWHGRDCPHLAQLDAVIALVERWESRPYPIAASLLQELRAAATRNL